MSGGTPPPCIGKLIDYEIRDEIMFFSAGDWKGCTPLRLFRIDMERARAVIAEHDARNAEVVEFRQEYPADKMRKLPKGGDHAA